MTRHQTALFRQLLLIADVGLSAIAFLAAVWLRTKAAALGLPEFFADLGLHGGDDPYSRVLLVMVSVWTFTLWTCRTSDFRVSPAVVAWRHARAVGLSLAALVVASFLFKWGFLSRSFVLLLGLTQMAVLSLGRVGLMWILRRTKRVDDHRVLVIGCGEAAVAFARSLRDRGSWNNRFVGHLCVPGEPCDAAAEPKRGELHELERLLDAEVIDEVVFAVPGRNLDTFEAALQACDLRGVDVLVTMQGMVPSSGKVEIASVTGFDMPMIGLSRVPTSQGRLLTKRVLDIVGSTIAILFAAPVMLAVAIAIRIESKGPVLFKQVRSGRNGRKFVMLKFRSMCTDAEAKLDALQHLNEMDGPVFKIKHDPRITRVGRFIRKTSLDELPQFFNVLFGDMSLVGPRPPLPSEVAKYEAWQRRRLSVRPGITGMWQVSGRNGIDFAQWMKLDLDYIDSWSLWLDLKILFRTLPAVLLRSGAS
ncbi:MAG: sugar transferase [Deltaproteobacteria bacterium]|nr:sugar transferase [Deltaproteobacteria bacterium]MBK8239906.1 sugar transferase [Deltaproteobacteria bacterium]MBP7286816.1 sugar transferase [Nannocystaceae bacterium]